MNYDEWKTQSPEDESAERKRRELRREWLEENADCLRDREIDDRLTAAGGLEK